MPEQDDFLSFLPRRIDYTNLKREATISDIEKLCEEAIKFKFYAVCVNPFYAHQAYKLLRNVQNVGICSVIDFPHGQATTTQRLYQIENLLNYTDEFDFVINIGSLKDKNYKYLEYEFDKIRELTRNKTVNKVVKAIIETPALEDSEKIAVTELIIDCELDFVKTATGTVYYKNLPPTENLKRYFNFQCLVRDVELLHSTIKRKNASTKIKASMGIDTLDKCRIIVQAGASRIGTSTNILEVI